MSTPTYATGRLSPNTLLNNRYLIVEPAGRGGMAAVYKATDTLNNHRIVAVKELSLSNVSPHKVVEARENFREEAEMLRRLSHPHLPKVYDFFDEGDRSYLVMQFIEGQTLYALHAQAPNQQLAINKVIDYAIQLCDVLSYLHTQPQPIIFRDLKPSNVMVTAQGHVYLIDFGIARTFKPEQPWDTTNMGTPGFCSPEQYAGHTSPCSDLYSLGATLHYCLSGNDPRKNSPTLFSFRPVRTYNPLVPQDLDKLIQHLVATEDTRRPASAEQVLRTLQSIKQWAAAGTSNLPGAITTPIALSFYNPYKARAAQFALQLGTYFNKLPGLIGMWSAKTLIPFLAQTYSLLTTWLVATFWPWIMFQSTRARIAFLQWLRDAQRGNSGFFTVLLRGFAPPVWQSSFVALLLLLPFLMIVSAFYMANALHWSLHQMGFAFCLLLMLFTLLASFHNTIQHALARSILLTSALVLFLVALTLAGLPDMQYALQTTTSGQLIGMLLISLAGASFLRPPERFVWLARLTILLLTLTCIALQFTDGVSEWRHFTFIPLVFDQMVNLVALGVLVAILLLTSVRFLADFTGLDRFLFLLLAIVVSALQIAFGFSFVSSLTITTNPVVVVMVQLLFDILPVCGALFWLVLPKKHTRWASVPLVLVTVIYVPLLLLLAGGVSLPFKTLPALAYPLQARLQTLFTPDQLLFAILLVLSVLLFTRFGRQFTGLDHIVLFSVVVCCMLLQNATWNQFMTASASGSSSLTADKMPALYNLAGNNLVTVILDAVVGIYVLFGIFALFAQLLHHMPRVGAGAAKYLSVSKVQSVRSSLEHVITLMATVACFVLQNTFGTNEPLLAYHLVLQTNWVVSFNTIVLGALVLLALLSLLRVRRPVNALDRFILLVDVLVCILLLVNGSPVMPRQIALPHIILPAFMLLPEVLLVALLGLLWLRRTYPQSDKNALLVLFVLACATGLLQVINPIFLLWTLFLLILGTVLATRIEFVRK